MLHTSYQEEAQLLADTGFGYTLSLIGGKYKMVILYWLQRQSLDHLTNLALQRHNNMHTIRRRGLLADNAWRQFAAKREGDSLAISDAKRLNQIARIKRNFAVA